MNILMVCALDVWSLGEGKGAPTLYRTLRAYDDNGDTVHLVSPRRGGDGGSKASEARPGRSFRNVHFWQFAFPDSVRWSSALPRLVATADRKLRYALLFPLLAAARGATVLSRQKIDLLYGYEVHGVLAVALLKRLWRLPSVSRFQGSVAYPTLGDSLAFVRKAEEVMALRTAADLYIMADDGTQGDRLLRRLNPSSASRLRFWRNGVDWERLRPPTDEEVSEARERLNIRRDTQVLLTANRLVSWKRIDRAIRALPEIVSHEGNVELSVVGDGEERANLERLAKQLGVADKVRFVGAVRHEEVVNYMKASDVFLSVNDLSNAGNPLMEAMACGKAIVTLNNGATGKLIEDCVTGLLVEPEHEGRLAQAVLRLLKDPDLRQHLGNGARQFAMANFWTWEERTAVEVEAVSQLVSTKHAVSARDGDRLQSLG